MKIITDQNDLKKYHEFIKQCDWLKNLNDKEFEYLISCMRVIVCDNNEIIIKQNLFCPTLNILYFGSLDITTLENGHRFNIAHIYDSGTIIGEFEFIDNSPYLYSVQVHSDNAVIIQFHRSDFSRKKQADFINVLFNKIKDDLQKSVSKKLRTINWSYVKALNEQVSQLKETTAFGQVFIATVASFAISVILTAAAAQYGIHPMNKVFGWFYQSMIALPTIILLLRFDIPFPDFGVSPHGFLKSAKNGVLIATSIIIIAFVFLFISANSYQKPLGMIFNIDKFLNPLGIASYFGQSYLQEFIARGCMQTIIQSLLKDQKGFLSITTTALFFSAFHLMFGLGTVIATFLAGLLFGYIYQRDKNLVGVSIVHTFLGQFVFALTI